MDTDIIKERIFDFAYHEALNDATIQKAYDGDKKTEIEDSIDAKAIVKKYIDGIVDDKDDNNNFWTVAQAVYDAIGDRKFTFGNVQKLINMTVKYIYISYYAKPEVKARFAECHCPMDSIMIKQVVTKYRKAVEVFDDAEESLLKLPNNRQNWSEVRWSKISYTPDEDIQNEVIHNIETYNKFQDMVKYLAKKEDPEGKDKPTDLLPIEYDFWLWNQKDEDCSCE